MKFQMDFSCNSSLGIKQEPVDQSEHLEDGSYIWVECQVKKEHFFKDDQQLLDIRLNEKSEEQGSEVLNCKERWLRHGIKVEVDYDPSVKKDSTEANTEAASPLPLMSAGFDHDSSTFNDRPHCPVCSKSFIKKSILKEHMKVHTEEKPYICTMCFRSFRHKHHVKDHMRTHTGDTPYHCQICSKKFRQGCDLKRHLYIHSGDKPYSCETCKKQFTRSSCLKQHLRIHTGEKPYCCVYCGSKFTQNNHLRRHMSIHDRL